MDAESDKFCPECGRNFSGEIKWCAHCQVQLVSENNLGASKQLFEENTVTVHIAETRLEAEILRGILEVNGINCALVGDVPPAIYPFTVDGLAKVRILVLENVAEEASKIIREALIRKEKYEKEFAEGEEEGEDENSHSQ